MIRLLIADDHGLIRRGIAQIVSESGDIVVAGEASTGEEALELARNGDFDVAILDVVMPGRGGLDVISDIRSANRNIKIIVLSMLSEEQAAVRCLRAGASAYLTKTSADAELVTAIRAVASGNRYITEKVAEWLAHYVYVENESELPPHERLAKREYQIFLFIGAGKTVSEIARELSLSVNTVSTYRSRILAKMGMKTNSQLMRYAVDCGLAP